MTNIKDIKILSSLEKIYDSYKMPAVGYKGFSMLKNEKKSFQVAVICDEEFTGRLSVKSLPNGDNPIRHGLTPLLAIDLWEHAYYLDYQNRKKEYLRNLFLIVNWKVVSSRLP